MAVVLAKSGLQVTIGDLSGGLPRQSTWGDKLRTLDAGVPLRNYSPQTKDPLVIWKTQPSVRKVVGFAARQVASLSWHCYQRADDANRVRKANSKVEALLRKPGPLVTGYILFEHLVIDYMLYDLALAVLVGDELVRIPPSMVDVKSDKLGTPRQVVIMMPAGDKDIDVTDAPKIFTFGWHSTKAGGVSPMHTLSAILNETRRSVEWRTRQWETSPKSAGILTRPPAIKWAEGGKERFVEEWRGWRDGTANGTPILEDGMTYTPLEGLNPKDAQDVEGRQLTDAEVASAFFMPPELVGARAGNFSNIKALLEMLFGPVLRPTVRAFQQAINQGGVIEAIDMTPNLYVEADVDAAMSGSRLDKARTLQTLAGGPVATVAEARSELNLPFIAGTEELIVPLNVTQGGLASPTDTGDQNLGGDNASPESRLDQ